MERHVPTTPAGTWQAPKNTKGSATKMNQLTPINNPDLMNRLKGIVMLQAPIYKEVAEDKSATPTAAMIVAATSILAGVGQFLGAVLRGRGNIGASLGLALILIVAQFLGWLLGSWLLAFVAKQFFQGDTDMGEMQRVNGFTRIFGAASVLSFIPVIGGLIGIAAAIAGIVGNVIGIREAAGFDTQKAILTALIAGVAAFVAVFAVVALLSIPFIGAAALSR